MRFRIIGLAILAFAAAGGRLGARAVSPRPDRSSDSASHVEALLINGGGTAATNYQSHLLHVRELVEILRRAAIPDRRITVLSGDGSNPAPDVALREVQPEENYWLVTGTRLEKPFRTPVTYESSAVDGLTLHAATRAEIQRWFATTGARLRKDDTLLLYVTDHGTKNKDDTKDNRITLWAGESLSVSDLGANLARLDPGVRVVMVMSQCYSGSFARLAWPAPAELPTGRVSGFFSTTAERPAYGCYPENKELENVGHSFEFLEELGASGSLLNAHLHVLQHDATPDVPLRTSDVFLEEFLRRKAKVAGLDERPFVDDLLRQAWRNKAAWEPEIRLLDAIGHNFGSFSPRTLAELDAHSTRLPEVSEQLSTHGRAWKTALGDANRVNLDRFLAKQPAWAELLRPEGSNASAPEGVRSLAGTFLYDLAEDTRTDASTEGRLATLRGKSEAAAGAAYRMDVRQSVVLRLRTILASIAGRLYLARQGTPRERAAYEALLACEGLSLPLQSPMPRTRAANREPFPSLEDDLRLAREVLPAWLGIRFGEPTESARAALELTRGAASVQAVYPDSPAEDAGLQVGDVILGPPDAPFQHPQQIREWTMLATVDRPATVEVLRGDEPLEMTLVPRAYPVKWPELSGPPQVSSPAPPFKPLQLAAYRGRLPDDLRNGTPHLLFFWATWCGPCKASVPEVLAFENERDTPVIAITDEPGETLDAFFRGFGKPFPERVATDEMRRAFLAYGVSGTPTFVLVDGKGVLRSLSVGYSPNKSLGVEGWKWSGATAAAGR